MDWVIDSPLQMPETNAESIEFTVKLGSSDLRRALVAWQVRKWSTWLLLGIGTLMLLGSLAEHLQGRAVPTPWLVIGLAWLIFPFLLPTLQVRKANLSPDGLAAARYKMDEGSIKRSTSGTEVELAWNVLYGSRETSRAFLVLTNKNCFFVIPKSSLDGDALLRTTRLLSRKLRKR